jgi:hypothetical protein
MGAIWSVAPFFYSLVQPRSQVSHERIQVSCDGNLRMPVERMMLGLATNRGALPCPTSHDEYQPLASKTPKHRTIAPLNRHGNTLPSAGGAISSGYRNQSEAAFPFRPALIDRCEDDAALHACWGATSRGSNCVPVQPRREPSCRRCHRPQ